MVKAIVFDCFGVLIEDALSVLTARLEDAKRVQVVDILHASHHGLLRPEESSRQIAALLDMTDEAYRSWLHEGEIKNRPLLEYIGELRDTYKTAILSNIGTGGLTRRFTPEELQLFDTVVASGEVGYAKPEAQAYEIVADRLGVRLEECVFTDDREEYVEGARGVGMQAFLYKDFMQFRSELEAILAP